MRTVLFVPGFQEGLKDRDYQSVLNAIEGAGYAPEFVEINWKYTVLKDWVRQTQEVYRKHDPAETVLSGFSFGAVTALAVAAERNPAELWLFSLSPYFEGDYLQQESYNEKKLVLRTVGKRRLEVFRALDFGKLTASIMCPTKVFYGEKEVMGIEERAVKCAESIRGAQLVKVPGAPHAVEHPSYVDTIRRDIT